MLKPSECRISRGSGSILSLLGTCQERPIVGRLSDLTTEQNPTGAAWVKAKSRSALDLPHTESAAHETQLLLLQRFLSS